MLVKLESVQDLSMKILMTWSEQSFKKRNGEPIDEEYHKALHKAHCALLELKKFL